MSAFQTQHKPTPPMQKPDTLHQEASLNNHYGESYTVYTTDVETQFPDGCLITSCTDLDGYITHANAAFVTLSGWEREDLIGSPHSILRHPDMPAVAFAGLWETLARGEKWHGYVKNLRKDGGFYWVYATVIPNIRDGKTVGYTSVRRKPSRAKITEMEQLYAQMRAAE